VGRLCSSLCLHVHLCLLCLIFWVGTRRRGTSLCLGAPVYLLKSGCSQRAGCCRGVLARGVKQPGDPANGAAAPGCLAKGAPALPNSLLHAALAGVLDRLLLLPSHTKYLVAKNSRLKTLAIYLAWHWAYFLPYG